MVLCFLCIAARALAGILSVLSTLVSLYITNRVMVFALPVLAYQILLESAGPGMYSVFMFRAFNKPFREDWQCLLFLSAVSAGIVSALAGGIFKKLQARG